MPRVRHADLPRRLALGQGEVLDAVLGHDARGKMRELLAHEVSPTRWISCHASLEQLVSHFLRRSRVPPPPAGMRVCSAGRNSWKKYSASVPVGPESRKPLSGLIFTERTPGGGESFTSGTPLRAFAMYPIHIGSAA